MSLRAPHAHEGITIPTLMFKVTLALLPAVIADAPDPCPQAHSWEVGRQEPGIEPVTRSLP